MDRARIVVAVGLVSLGMAGAGQRAAAQELRGVVRDSASRLPIPGAVVTLQDSTAAPVARTITNERGQFRAVLLGGGVRRVRVIRLGFRPAVVTLPEPTDGVIRVDVVMASVSMSLTPVQVNAGPSCPRRGDRAVALGVLEQARAGLLATVVARSDKPAHMMRLRAIRTMDGFTDRILHQRVRVDTGATFGSFGAARNATDFVRNGFTADSGGQTVFYGPDAEVLLDDRFAAGYCFHMMDADRGRPNQIGLGFGPAARKNGRVDVDGALWIDTVARALVDIDFRYLGIDPRAEPFRPGGRISFREMPNGVVVIDRWSIRLVTGNRNTSDPFYSVIRPLTPDGRPVSRDRSFYGVEVWGELARATWPDGYSWAGPLGTLHLRVVDPEGKPVPGTIVRLADTDYEATADSSGNIELPDLVPGPYAVSLIDPELAALGITVPTDLGFVAARRWTILTRLPVRDMHDHVAERCRTGGSDGSTVRSQAVPGSAWLVGRIVTPDGLPIPDARWSIRFRDVLGEHRPVKDAAVGPDGVFQYCQLRRGENVVIDVRAKGMAETTRSVMLSRQTSVLTVVMTPRQ
jgi:hypothetical protein